MFTDLQIEEILNSVNSGRNAELFTKEDICEGLPENGFKGIIIHKSVSGRIGALLGGYDNWWYFVSFESMSDRSEWDKRPQGIEKKPLLSDTVLGYIKNK